MIEFWDTSHREGMNAMFSSWIGINPSIEVKPTIPDYVYIDKINSLLDQAHSYIREFRTIIKVNNKYIFMDAVDRPVLAAESYKVPFDLICKFQFDPTPGAYAHSIAPVVPFTYTLRKYNMDFIYKNRELRKEIMNNKQFTSSIYWGGGMKSNRHVRRKLRHSLTVQAKKAICATLGYDDYMKMMATTLAGVAVSGRGDFCYRDIELAGMGTPFFRQSFANITRNPRIPNIHYYSINGGLQQTLQHYINYFEPNGELRNFTPEEWDKHCEISNNSMKWFDENSSPEGSFKVFCEILEENNII